MYLFGRRMCARSTAFILILNGGVCLPRKKKVVEEDVVLTSKPTYSCLRCGTSDEDPVGTFYRLPHSLLYKANNCYAPLCKKCVNSLFDEFKTRYGSERTACILCVIFWMHHSIILFLILLLLITTIFPLAFILGS